jgi:hypothetical protein
LLLTDGADSRGPRPVDAAQQPADRWLRVSTNEFGTTPPVRWCAPSSSWGVVCQVEALVSVV